MHTFDDLVGKAIAATRSCLFEAKSGKKTYRTIFHVTKDHGILLFCVSICDSDTIPQTENVFASKKEIMLCALEPSFQNTLRDLGIEKEEIQECVNKLTHSHVATGTTPRTVPAYPNTISLM